MGVIFPALSVKVFRDKIVSMADVGAGGEEAVVNFDGIAILTPRWVTKSSHYILNQIRRLNYIKMLHIIVFPTGVATVLNFIFLFCVFKGKQMTSKFSSAVLFVFFVCPRFYYFCSPLSLLEHYNLQICG